MKKFKYQKLIKERNIKNKTYSIFRLSKKNKNYFDIILKIIKEQNKNTLLSFLSKKIIKKILKKLIQKNYFYIIVVDEKCIGYVIFSKNYSSLKNFFSIFKEKIILDLLVNFKFIKLFNILLNLILLFQFNFINKKKYKILNKNVHLSYLAITKNFQSKNIGTFFVKSCLNDLKKLLNFNKIFVIASKKRTIKFYKENLDFVPYFKFCSSNLIQHVLKKSISVKNSR